MSQAIVDASRCTPNVLLDELSREFSAVVRRVNERWNDVPVRDQVVEGEPRIEAAQRSVDLTASAMLQGACGRADWSLALSEYEQAWAQLFESLGDRRN